MRNFFQLVILICIATLCNAGSGEPHPNAEVLGKLVYSDISIDVEQITAKEAIEKFKEDLDILMNVYWQTDEKKGLDPDALITLTLKNQPALVILERILEQIGDSQDATWQLRHGVLDIGLKVPLALRTSYLESYPIQDLLFKIRNFTAPELGTFNGDGRGGVEGTQTSTQEEIDRIIELVVKFVEPELWEQNGGTCSITNYKKTLLIKAPDFVHRQIGGYSFEAQQPNEVRRRRVLYQGLHVEIIVDRIPLR